MCKCAHPSDGLGYVVREGVLLRRRYESDRKNTNVHACIMIRDSEYDRSELPLNTGLLVKSRHKFVLGR